MRLILHIGTRKTGSTTLQRTLQANPRFLRRHRASYPSTTRSDFSHRRLICLVAPYEGIPRRYRFTPDGERDLGSLRQMGDELWEDILREVSSSNPETVVLSSEDFFYLDPEAIVRLRDLVGDLTDEISVVAYVRSPASYYLSLAQEVAKNSHAIPRPDRFDAEFRRRLTTFREMFGPNLSVRRFDRSTLRGGCIVQDFLGATIPESLPRVEKLQVRDINTSSSAEGACILQQLRRYGWTGRNGLQAPEGRHVVAVLKELETRVPQHATRLRSGIADSIDHAHRGDLDWLREEFGVDLAARGASVDASCAPEGWTSDQLVDILDVDRADVDRIAYELMKELAIRATTEPRDPTLLLRARKLAGRTARALHLRPRAPT